METTTPINSSFLQASDELLRNSERLRMIVEQACAQLAHNLFLPFEKEDKVEETIHKYGGEQEELIPKSSQDDVEQSSSLVVDHVLPSSASRFEELCTKEEMQEDHMEEMAWELALHCVLGEEWEKAKRKVVYEEVNIEEEGDIGCSQGEEI
ncbi:unnamed protein product [Linum trigynum]|uniref:Uncharacterized protein n=1 Tax=Linum trigynum TaxID=586398 RepID=A0AAV2CWA6_9ROSI